MMAIYKRNETGMGGEIDVSAVEAGITLLGPIMLDVAVNKRVTRGDRYPTGNRPEFPRAAPHGIYPANAEDRWIAIAVFEEDWATFLAATGLDLADDPRFATLEARQANMDALDGLVSGWSRTRDPHDAMTLLQKAGIAAGAVQNSQDLAERDPQIAHRGLFFELDHPVIGPALFEGEAMKFSRSGLDNWRSAPLLGEDNDYVYRDVLGYDADTLADYAERGII